MTTATASTFWCQWNFYSLYPLRTAIKNQEAACTARPKKVSKFTRRRVTYMKHEFEELLPASLPKLHEDEIQGRQFLQVDAEGLSQHVSRLVSWFSRTAKQKFISSPFCTIATQCIVHTRVSSPFTRKYFHTPLGPFSWQLFFRRRKSFFCAFQLKLILDDRTDQEWSKENMFRCFGQSPESFFPFFFFTKIRRKTLQQASAGQSRRTAENLLDC